MVTTGQFANKCKATVFKL